MKITTFTLALAAFMQATGAQAAEPLLSGPTFDGWVTVCRVDAINDIKNCFAIKGGMSIHTNTLKGWWLRIGREHYPRSSVYLRLDKNPAINTTAPGWSGPQAEHWVGTMRAHETATIRYTIFAGVNVVTEEVDLKGLPSAVDYIMGQTREPTKP